MPPPVPAVNRIKNRIIPEKKRKRQKMRPACPVIKHLPFVEAEHENHHGRVPAKTDPVFFPVRCQNHGRKPEA